MKIGEAKQTYGFLIKEYFNKQKEHKSLWEDEEEKTYADPMEVADNTEDFADGPEVVDVETTLESVDVSI